LTLSRNGTITGTPPDTTAGTYRFRLRVVTADNLTATSRQTITVAPGCVSPTPSPTPGPTPTPPSTTSPVVVTGTSSRRVTPGQPFHDRIHVRGLAGDQPATAVARLYGPFESRAAASCDAEFRVRAHALQVRNGWNRTTPDVRIATPGVYTWTVTLLADADNQSATHRCGQAAETTVVAKPPFVAPAVVAGFSGTIDTSDRARRAPATTRIRMPAIGMHALVRRERIARGRMTLPGDVGEVGWLRNSAGIGDMIGAAVVAGHVSDRHDKPGAMARLGRARAGQRITVTQAGTRHRYEVVSKATFDRRTKLPRRYFDTTGRHRLVLISCTARVVRPDGHFHYTRYIVVVAKRVRRDR
jgi:sortase (surface protein transpeptidase)